MVLDSLASLAPLLIAAAAIMAASLSGVLLAAQSLDHWLCRHIALLVSLSAGVFGVVALNLLREAHDELDASVVLLTAGAGFCVLWLVSALLPESHHHHDPDSPDEPTHAHGKRILLADALHNIGDGVVLAAGFAASTTLGIGIAVSIFIHEAVQELSEYFVLRHSGYTKSRALVLNAAVATTLFLGVALGLLLAELYAVLPYLLAGAAGAFLFVVVKDLLPESLRASGHNARRLAYHGAAIAVGIALMSIVSLVVPAL